MLTVACVWVRSEVYDSPEWVEKLYSMAQRWIGCSNYPFEFLCITPHGDALSHRPEIKTVKPEIRPDGRKFKPWWYKVNLWLLGGERVLYLDLDTVVMRGLQPLVDFPSDLVVAPSNGVPMRDNSFNSSVMAWCPDCYQVREIIRPSLDSKPWERWVGDQQWLSFLPMRVDLFPSRWVHKYLPASKVYVPPADTIVTLLIQGGKNRKLIETGHTWVGNYWL